MQQVKNLLDSEIIQAVSICLTQLFSATDTASGFDGELILGRIGREGEWRVLLSTDGCITSKM